MLAYSNYRVLKVSFYFFLRIPVKQANKYRLNLVNQPILWYTYPKEANCVYWHTVSQPIFRLAKFQPKIFCWLPKQSCQKPVLNISLFQKPKFRTPSLLRFSLTIVNISQHNCNHLCIQQRTMCVYSNTYHSWHFKAITTSYLLKLWLLKYVKAPVQLCTRIQRS